MLKPIVADALLHVDSGLELLCFKPAEDGPGFILRLVDTMGTDRPAALAVRRPAKSVTRCNLLEVPMAPSEAGNGHIRFVTKPFEVHTFKVVF